MSAPTVQTGLKRVNGHQLFYTIFGPPDKGTILGLHGGPGLSHEYLLPLFDLAPLGYRVVLYDQLGCGASARFRSSRAYTFEGATDDVEGLRRGLGLGKIHLLGHSYGGSLALNSIDRYPQSFRSVTFASAPIGDAEVLEREFKRLARRLPPKVRRWWTRPNPKLADMWNPSHRRGFREYSNGYESFSHLRVCRLRTMPHELVRSMQSQNLKVAAGIRASLRGRRADSAKALRRLRLPCLVTAGRYDQIPVGVARNIHELVPRSRLEIFERSAHLPHFEERDRYIDVLRNFLDAVR